MMHKTDKICNSPHTDGKHFCIRAKGHANSHWTWIEGVKYFWS